MSLTLCMELSQAVALLQSGTRARPWDAAQLSLQGLQTPAIMVFLHLVPTMGALWLLSSVRPLHLRALQGCSIQAALAGVQVRASTRSCGARLGRQPTLDLHMHRRASTRCMEPSGP